MTKSINVLYIVVFVTYMGLACPIPLLAPFLHQYHETTTPFLYGETIACHAIGMLIGAPLLGTLADRIGKVTVLRIALGASVVGSLLAAYIAYHHDLVLFMACRFFSGLFEGNIAVSRALLADLGEGTPTAFGRISMAMNGGFIVGPFLSMQIAASVGESPLQFSFSFCASAVAMAIAAVLACLFLEERTINIQRNEEKTHLLSSTSKVIERDWLIRFAVISIAYLANDLFCLFYCPALLLAKNSGVNTLGMSAATVASSHIFGQLVVIPFLEKRNIQCAPVIAPCICMLGITLFCIATTSFTLFVALFLVGNGISIVSVSVTASVAHQAPIEKRGQLLGFASSLRYFSNILVGMCGGSLAIFDPLAPLYASIIMYGSYLASSTKMKSMEWSYSSSCRHTREFPQHL